MAVKIKRGYYGPSLAKKGTILTDLDPLEEKRLVEKKIAEYVELEGPLKLDVEAIKKERNKTKLLALAQSNGIPLEGSTIQSIKDSILNYLEEQEDLEELEEVEAEAFEGE